ncbi:MAG: CHASE2 domain-containing protein [Treponema sp.]|nr:CHASE2 domain-containing protein [Treponema sp.]
MKKGTKRLFFLKNLDIIVLVFLFVMCSIGAFFSVFTKIDYRIYDFLLGRGHSIEESDKIMLIDIDDLSLDDIGVWPWNRDIIADMLIRAREFGAYNMVFDIEYLQKSVKALVPDAQQEVEESISSAKVNIESVISQFADAAVSGSYSSDELHGISQMLVDDYVNPAIDEIKSSTNLMSRDNDDYFARALQFFGNAWMTVNVGMPHELDSYDSFDNVSEVTEEQVQFMNSRDYAASRFLLSQVKDDNGLIEKGNSLSQKEQDSYRGFYPVRLDFLKVSSGIGVTNVIVDKDGTRRRIELLSHLDPEKKFMWTLENGIYQSKSAEENLYAPQLSFAPLLSYLGVQSVERTLNSLILRDAKLPGKEKLVDIRIPLDANGCMHINWLKKNYINSFRNHVSFAYVYELDRAEERIVRNLSNITKYQMVDENGYALPYYQQAMDLLSLYGQIKSSVSAMLAVCNGYDEKGMPVKAAVSDALYRNLPSSMQSLLTDSIEAGKLSEEIYNEYFEMRNKFYEGLRTYVEASFKQPLIEEFAHYDNGENSETIQGIQAEISQFFDGLDYDYSLFRDYYDELKKKLEGSFCILGNTATASTDLGVTPFERRYPNLGTHANVVNTILQQDFIRPLPLWINLIFSFILTIATVVLTKKMSNGKRNVFSLVYLVTPVVFSVALMILFNIYIPLFSTVVFVVFAYITNLVLNFIAVEKDRSTLRRGFDAYVAPEVVNQIVKDPSRLGLGGVNKNITALFSDVRKFSGFTEMINNEEGESNGAVRLVAILNEYLGKLSDAIMESKGTIDKYVGDEIVSFFGAPIDDPFNAFNACVAGIRMKQVEDEYNAKHFDSDHDIPMRLESRVGINSGDMVVGNMGTEKKLNYTIMGNNVNLASRLEGTNKVYGSWIMCSESTWKAADSGEKSGLLVARNFDCVQVINVKKPVQLYNILGLKSELPPEQIEAAEIFNAGINLYLNGRDTPEEKKDLDDLRKAYNYFEQAAKCYPKDESSKVFMERCKQFITNGLPDVWDGVYIMQSK